MSAVLLFVAGAPLSLCSPAAALQAAALSNPPRTLPTVGSLVFLAGALIDLLVVLRTAAAERRRSAPLEQASASGHAPRRAAPPPARTEPGRGRGSRSGRGPRRSSTRERPAPTRWTSGRYSYGTWEGPPHVGYDAVCPWMRFLVRFSVCLLYILWCVTERSAKKALVFWG